MSLIGLAIIISILIVIGFGWDYMISLWAEFFDFLRELGGAILDKADKPRLLP